MIEDFKFIFKLRTVVNNLTKYINCQLFEKTYPFVVRQEGVTHLAVSIDINMLNLRLEANLNIKIFFKSKRLYNIF